ncbi:hypothetical protein [Bosea sp. LjRoot237]
MNLVNANRAAIPALGFGIFRMSSPEGGRQLDPEGLSPRWDS